LLNGAAVLCMAHGSPDGEAGIEPYFTNIRGGRPPAPEALEHLRARYRAVGGSPLTAITEAQADALCQELGIPTFVGMKHAAPFIDDAVARAKVDNLETLIALPLAPHYEEMSAAGYLAAIQKTWDRKLIFIRGFHDHPAFVAAVRNLIKESLSDFDAQHVIFTAHSLPGPIEKEGDPYRERLLESCRLVARSASLTDWEFAFQSASETGEPSLGPSLTHALETTRAKRVLVCPIGSVADHLEVLYDIDIEAKALAARRGVELRRTPSFNARPAFIKALAAIVRDAVLPH
jgi:ferrochelatase